MTEYSLQIQLEFENPIGISQNMEPDWLEIIFKCPYFFVSTDSQALGEKNQNGRILSQLNSKLPPELIRKKRLPPQMNEKQSTKSAQKAIEAVLQITDGAFYFTLILNFIMQASLAEIFGLFEILQLIVLIPLFQIILPANAAGFFNILMEIAAFDFLGSIDMVSWILPDLEETDPINNNFEGLGFETLYFMNNMGTGFFFFVAYFLALLITDILVAAKTSN